MDRLFTAIATRIAAFAGQPVAFVLALALIGLWGVLGPVFHYSDTWQLVVNTATTIVTFLMVFPSRTRRTATARRCRPSWTS